MIQRIQTIWLLLASLCAFLTLKFSFYSGTTLTDPHIELNARYSIVLTILTVIVGTLAAVCIFLYKNRKTQMRLAFFGVLLQIGCIAYYFKLIQDFTAGNYALWSILSFAVLIFFILAISAINKDQKLVKSLSRLR